jgi:ribonuclease-3
MTGLDGLERAIGYAFRNRELLEEALTHSSFANEQPEPVPRDNERLEFMGDSVLAFVVTDLLFDRNPAMDEGRLSRLRAFLVSAANLVVYAERIHLGEYLRLGRGEERTGGRGKPAVLVDAFEAVIGALYRDAGPARTRDVLAALFEDQIGGTAGMTDLIADFKSVLQEALQKAGRGAEYCLTDEQGPDHRKVFSVEVRVGGELVSVGTGRTRKAAEQEAARGALNALGIGPGSIGDDPPGGASRPSG